MRSGSLPTASNQQLMNPIRIRVLTLNLAHGRKNGISQALQRQNKIKRNLDQIAQMLRRRELDLVALQEADGPSLWSGRFNHVEYLARAAKLDHYFRGNHVRMLRLDYGTAVLSNHRLQESRSFRFSPSPPMPPKGFVISTIEFPIGEQQSQGIDVVSVHFDFARKGIRKRQCDELIEQVRQRENPLILMGDFNCEYAVSDSPLKPLVEQLKLHAFEPQDRSLITFPRIRKRIDWVFCSDRFQFVHHEVLSERLSDHRAILAELELTPVESAEDADETNTESPEKPS